MVASENAETTGIIRDRFVKAKFGRKVGDGIFNRASGSGFSVGIVPAEIFLEFLKNLLQFAQKSLVLRKFFQPGLPRKLQHSDRIVIGPVPKLGIELPEQAAGGGFPSPPKIETHLPQWLKHRRQGRSYIVNLKSRHANAAGETEGELIKKT